jgi:hypothetical protein
LLHSNDKDEVRITGHVIALLHFGCRREADLCGGGSIPFLRMLGERFAETQFLVTGVLGPHSNAHGPNEFLHIAYATRLTECVSLVLADHGSHLANRGAT